MPATPRLIEYPPLDLMALLRACQRRDVRANVITVGNPTHGYTVALVLDGRYSLDDATHVAASLRTELTDTRPALTW